MENKTWNVGDIAICVDVSKHKICTNEIPPLLILYHEYLVADVQTCKKCGIIILDVGIQTSNTYIMCSCKTFFNTNNIHWCRAKRFVKKKPMDVGALLESILEKKEDVVDV